MHSYAIDTNDRKWIPLYIASASITIAFLMDFFNSCGLMKQYWFIGLPSVVGLYGILWLLFKERIWKWSFLRKLHVVNVPNLAGVWKGRIESKSELADFPIEATLRIKHNWSEISITLVTCTSESHSLVATLLTGYPLGPILKYEYRNRTTGKALDTMHDHTGFAELRLEGCDLLEGEYYTCPDRCTGGTMRFQREALSEQDR